ncbi:MAG: hypothetical protein IT331_04585 [Anaerolineae bacterium]|nr:hypothetical protein [Anaerolineae bacterium]
MKGRIGCQLARLASIVPFLTWLVALAGCGNLPIVGGLGGSATPERQITFEGAVTLNVKVGGQLAGTGIVYQGKAPDGRAVVMIDGLQGLKSTADSVKWTGALVLFSLVDLNLRVVTYDESSMNLAGTIRIVVQEPNPTPGDIMANPMATFTIPLTYVVNKNTTIPGTNVTFEGADTGGARFQNLDQIPFRERFDSVVWQGHLRERIAVRYELRLLDFNDERAILGGTAGIVFEP